MAIKRVGILVGGGPAPGTNGVISAVVIEAIKMSCTPVGFHDGFEWLAGRYTDEQHEMTIEEVSRIHLDGGSILGTSRTDITRDAESLDNVVAALRKLGIEALITIGGDDLVRSSAAVERATAGAIKVVQVPKSIDNDLWLPLSVSTLGFETARHVGVQLVQRLMEDAKTTGRWYLGVTMGRPTGHLTLGIGKAASATCTIIPEEFKRSRVSLSDICDVVEGTIIKRRAMNRPHGVILLAEALVERFDPDEVAELQDVDRDAQGNIRVAEIDLGRKVKSEVQARLERRGIKVTLVDKTIGYELRCAPPIPYDAEYARDLGYAAFRHLYDGDGSGTMITIQGGEFRPVPFAEVIDAETGRGRQRPVDVDTESYQVARDYMVRIGEKDFREEAWVAKLAAAAELTPEEFVTRFGSQP
ncbi:MAG: ATP-dependent phosphofructokinase / diphosphate-dependent phosphofructokinase [Acidobacteriota bacterium]|jgi:6-phosphofructokinase 1|nr:ATP-dependent phosphofructokinase / diphosphate-dependent phosphofructokinase [Acidobacteriota bacterium]